MTSVLLPFALLISIAFFKKIPVIGGNIKVALLVAGFSAMLLGGVYSPVEWVSGWIFGINKLSWILFLILFGGIYAETQTKLKSVDTVFNLLRVTLGKSPRLLIFVIMLTLTIAGSLLGDAVAAATVIGVLAVGILIEIGLTNEQTAATLTMGAALGSIMPPITQALFLSCSLLGIDETEAVNISYLTIGLGLVLCSLYVSRWVKIDKIPEHLVPKDSAFVILRKGAKNLIPLAVLITIVVLKAGFDVDVFAPLDDVFAALGTVPILKGITFRINKALLFCFLLTMIYPVVRNNAFNIIKEGTNKTIGPVLVLVCAGFMIGAYYNAGQIEYVKEVAVTLNEHVLKFGGAFSMTLMGMLTGSQSTVQNTIFMVVGPAWVAHGVSPVNAAIAGSHLAMSGQGMPPADLITFVTAGLVGSITGAKVDPLKAMMHAMFLCFYFMIVGLIFLYI